MTKRKRTPRATENKSVGQLFGLELFEDSRLLRVIVCSAHYDAVDENSMFPLADVADRTVTNANIVLYLVQPHLDDAEIHLVHHHRYFHRDSQHPADGLDLKRTYNYVTRTADGHDIEALVQEFFHMMIEKGFPLTAPPEVFDFSTMPMEQALDAYLKLPFIHSYSAAVQ
jgi:hypothetical protein